MSGMRVYVVPGAVQPVLSDMESGCGRYEAAHIWMRHAIVEPNPRVTLRGVDHARHGALLPDRH
jgi:hypothetical protein